MQTVILVVHVLICVALVALVLLQQGKGADAGAAFGSGASQTVFGARGSASFLSRASAALAAGFFATSLSLAYLFGHEEGPRSVTEFAAPAAVPAETMPSVPEPVQDGSAGAPAVPAIPAAPSAPMPETAETTATMPEAQENSPAAAESAAAPASDAATPAQP